MSPITDPANVLAWDSEQFGFPVARIANADSPTALVQIAERLRDRGVKLAYFNTPTAHPELSSATLAAVGGHLADVRLTYSKSLLNPDDSFSEGQASAPNTRFAVDEYRSDQTPLRLIELSRAAGEYSRFRTDPRIKQSVFERIYDAWIERSVRHEIADAVFVARRSEDIVGLITWKYESDLSQIGLVAVHADTRGQGVGRQLLRAAAARMSAVGSREARVVTQAANAGACRLYEAAGFSEVASERCYHLWL